MMGKSESEKRRGKREETGERRETEEMEEN